ncbi:MAG: DUF3971 domain-containing protein [Epsilonproteobacteria bacterium]|nr:DUF3971 domain-containing protein [Campylobacterota bacterium]
MDTKGSSKKLPLASIDLIPKIFEKIKIERIDYKEPFSLDYDRQLLRLRSKNIEAQMKFYYHQGSIYLQIQRFLFTPLDLLAHGIAKIDKNRAHLQADLRIHGIKAKIRLDRKADLIEFYLTSQKFDNTSLSKLLQSLPLHPKILAWSTKRVKASSYQLLSCTGRFHLGDGLDFKSLKALAAAYDVQAFFHPKLPKARAKEALLRYSGDTLQFDLSNPSYEKIDLTGSWVKIKDLRKPHKSSITIHIHTDTPYHRPVRRLLKAYGIDLPIRQKRGSIQADLNISYHFRSKKVTAQGAFRTKESDIQIAGIDLTLHKAYLKLKNTRAILKPSTISIKPLVTAKVQGVIDPLKAKLKAQIQRARLSFDGYKIFDAKDLKERIDIDLQSKSVTLSYLPISIELEPKLLIKISDITKLRPFSPLIQKLDPKAGKLIIKGRNYQGYIIKEASPFLKAGRPLRELEFKGDWRHIAIEDFFDLRFKPLSLHLGHITLDASGFDLNGSKHKLPKLKLSFKECNITKKGHLLFIKHGQAQIQDGLVKAKIHTDSGTAKIAFYDGYINVVAKNLSDTFVKNLFHIDFIEGGSYDFTARGKLDQFEGNISIVHGSLKNLTLINNLLAFFNTIPALVTLQDPGFSAQGLPIEEGSIEYRYFDQKIAIPSLTIVSKALEIYGSGLIDLQKGTIAMEMKLASLKSVSNIVSKIPLAGYILLGDDGKITTSFSITGDLDDPAITTHMTKDIIKMPFGIIKRTLELPFKLFE